MTAFLLMRHAQPDFSGPRKWDAPGWGVDMAPLTDFSEQQINQQLNKIREFNPEIIIASPMTRAVHSVLVILREINVPFKVEFDLHEWVPDRTFKWQTLDEVQKLQSEFEHFQGEWPQEETKPWETLTSVRQRVFSVLGRYLDYN